MRKILIIGYGNVGKMYESILKSSTLHYFDVVTMDTEINSGAMYSDLDKCITEHPRFDCTIVCTPNNTHYSISKRMIEHSGVVLVEKPGFKSAKQLRTLYDIHQNIFVVKNNYFRDVVSNVGDYVMNNHKHINSINIDWRTKNRIPSPGSWFTNKRIAWGGTSRDILPHLLNIYYGIFFESDKCSNNKLYYRYSLNDLNDTDYGTIDKGGVFDVDDACEVTFADTIPTKLSCSWKEISMQDDIDIKIQIHLNAGQTITYDLGLCPEQSYLRMVDYYLDIEDEDKEEHHNMDMWMINTLEEIENNHEVVKL